MWINIINWFKVSFLGYCPKDYNKHEWCDVYDMDVQMFMAEAGHSRTIYEQQKCVKCGLITTPESLL